MCKEYGVQGNLGELGTIARSLGAIGDAARGEKARKTCLHSQVDGLYIDVLALEYQLRGFSVIAIWRKNCLGKRWRPFNS